MRYFWFSWVAAIVALLLIGCRGAIAEDPQAALPTGAAGVVMVPADLTITPPSDEPTFTATPFPTPAVRPTFPSYSGTPTPDAPHLTTVELATAEHVVQFGESLLAIAEQYSTDVDTLLLLNAIDPEDLLQAGQLLQVPRAPDIIGSAFKLIPDSELVYGPAAADFDVRQFLETYYPHAALRQYIEEVEGRVISGPQIVDLVAVRYSVNPRLLLAVIEFRSGWVTRPAAGTAESYPLGFARTGYEGLFQQLNWAANRLNEGFYGRAEGGRHAFLLEDGTRVGFAPTINHGTAGVQNWLAADPAITLSQWQKQSGPEGFITVYQALFGDPFGFARPAADLWPARLTQPPLVLPWEEGVPWYFTSGPHGGWASGSAWASLDFAPDRDQLGCYISETWVTAAAAGQVVFSDFGGIVVDLDADGFMGTGWTIIYWHLHTDERRPTGEFVDTGDRLGHASCEGGFSNGAHLHMSRRYNGRWVAADGDVPFNLEGWVSQGAGREYDGYLIKGDESVEACACAEDGNEIVR